MTGSEKQIQWAERIISEFRHDYEVYASRFEAAGKVEDAAKMRAGVATMIEQHTEATWWIDASNAATLRQELGRVVMGR